MLNKVVSREESWKVCFLDKCLLTAYNYNIKNETEGVLIKGVRTSFD